jgi:hypothetical protein
MTDVAKLPSAPKLEVPPTYDNMVPHELANLLPMIEGNKFAELKEDIRKNGILEPIKLFDARILDGRNRYKAGKEVGYKFSAKDFEAFEGDYAAAEAYVFSTNFLRRQLTNAQKNDVIKTMIGKYPNESNRQIARRCGLNSHSQVANVRDKMSEPTPEQKKFADFRKTWDALADDQREAFVREFAPDIRELLVV